MVTCWSKPYVDVRTVPHFHGIADDIRLIHSMHSDQFNHAPAELLVYAGSPRMGTSIAGLIKDSRKRGLLKEKLVIWGGELGRTPFREGRPAKRKRLGRDHYPDAITMRMAGGQ